MVKLVNISKIFLHSMIRVYGAQPYLQTTGSASVSAIFTTLNNIYPQIPYNTGIVRGH